MKVTIFWTCSHKMKAAIVKEFGLPSYVSLNGETQADVSAEVHERLTHGEEQGYFRLRNKNK